MDGSEVQNNLSWLHSGIKKIIGKMLFDIQMAWNYFSSEDRKEKK